MATGPLVQGRAVAGSECVCDCDDMRIALYTLALDLLSGKESVVLELVRRSRHDWTVLTSRFEPTRTFPELAELDVIDLRHAWYARHVSNERGLVADACRHLPFTRLPVEGHDGLHVVSAGLEHLVGRANVAVPLTCTCLTPLRLAYDPEMRSQYGQQSQFGVAKRVGAAAFRAIDARAWNRYAGIFCISNTVRKRLLAPGRVDPTRTTVIFPGVDAEGVVPAWRRGDYFLVPGRLNWTKRIELALEAYRRFLALENAPRDFGLVVAGSASDSDTAYVETLREIAGEDRRVRFVLSPTRAELRALYDGCRAVLFTAVNEDFGIVPLEGMAHGKPVVCTAGGGPSETVLHRETGFLCSDVDGLASALWRLAVSPQLARELGDCARTRALEFDWAHFVTATDERLEQVLTRG